MEHRGDSVTTTGAEGREEPAIADDEQPERRSLSSPDTGGRNPQDCIRQYQVTYFPRCSHRTALFVVAVLVGIELGTLAAYLAAATATPHSPRYYVYPFLWINVAVWLFLRVRPRTADRSPLAVLGAAAYLLVVLAVAGTVGLSDSPHAHGWVVEWLAPGWGPYVAYDGTLLSLSVVPFTLIGHLGLAYLVYVALARSHRSAAIGAGGLVTCVGCVWPAATALSAAVSGGAGLAAVGQWSYDLATLIFLGTVAAMWWLLAGRPTSATSGRLPA